MRKNSGTTDHFDFLPFIAILMCVLGVLLLVTISMAAISMGAGVGEIWTAGSDAFHGDKVPILIEWNGKTAIVHNDHQRIHIPFTALKSHEIVLGGVTYGLANDKAADPNPLLTQEIARIAKLKATHYVLFAVRPSGFDNFFEITREFRHADITIGYEPIDQSREVDLRIGNAVGGPRISPTAHSSN